MKAYLDIETSFDGAITVVGVYRKDLGLVQLVGEQVTAANLAQALEGVDTICTYNGSRFDLPVLRRCLGVCLEETYRSHDLMYDCWRQGLYGGLKGVERQLGIGRQTQDIDGWDAMRLWQAYADWGDEEALTVLLDYNREDVLNLLVLEHCLAALPEEAPYDQPQDSASTP